VAKPFREKDLLIAIAKVLGRFKKAENSYSAEPTLSHVIRNDEKYVQLFVQLVPQRIETLQSALLNKDWPLLKKTAHMMKPQLLAFGLDEAESIIPAIEESNDPAKLQELGVALIQKASQLLNELSMENKKYDKMIT
jgi:HPt (histidine-containing phosphotransfer) domain-containing protein